jgi:hypothetical protein
LHNVNDGFCTVSKTYLASESTRARYRYIAALEWRRLCQEAPTCSDSATLAGAEHAAALVRYIGGRRPQVTANTWYQLKSAVALWLRELGFQDEAERVRALDRRGCRRPGRRPAKQISQADFQRLTNAVRRTRGLWGPRAAAPPGDDRAAWQFFVRGCSKAVPGPLARCGCGVSSAPTFTPPATSSSPD